LAALAAHVLFFALLLALGEAEGRDGALALRATPQERREGEPAQIDLAAADEVLPLAQTSPPVLPVPPPAPAPTAPIEDTGRLGAERSRHQGELPAARPPRPDRGLGAGRPHPPAFRADRSTLHERLTDGAEVDQPARSPSSSAASSPQAVRREPVTGEGDSVATASPSGTAPPAAAADPAAQPSGDRRSVEREGPPKVEAHPGDFTAVASSTLHAGRGPIEAEKGVRLFDEERLGPARENDARRAASAELRPGRMDLNSAATLGAGVEGHGPSSHAGALPSLATGTAGAVSGGASSGGPSDEQAARERHYVRYHQEIARRVAAALVFPRKLALRLEQGESIVRFTVLPSGRLGGAVEVQKSSGFSEFDEAARRAVERGAPFPPLPPPLAGRPLPVSLRVPFENPVVR
jgi:TonB family protein